MQILKIDVKTMVEHEMNQIVDFFRAGKIVAYPTETVYGLGCIATNDKSVSRIFDIKKRDKDKPMLVLIKSYCMLKKYCFVSARQDKFLRAIWISKTQNPKLKIQKSKQNIVPTSVILRSRGLLSKSLTGNDESIAVRMPVKSDFLMQVLKKVNVPIVSTSLNISGNETLVGVENIDKYFDRNKIDLVIDAGKNLNKKSSRLIDIRDMGDIKILRSWGLEENNLSISHSSSY